MNFGEMQAAVFDDLNFGSAPATVIVTRVKRWLNEGQARILRTPGMTKLRQGTISFDTVVGRGVYGVAQAFDREPDAIVQQSNNWRLEMRSRDWWRTVDPGEVDTGNPYVWVPEGLTPVLVQPASTGLWAVSTDAADTTQAVKFEGIRANGDEQAAGTATLTGLTRVQLGTITDYKTVLMLSLSAVAAGTVEIYNAAVSGTLLSRIPIGAKAIQYSAIRLWPTPAAVLTYLADGQFKIRPMVNDSDVPMLPDSYHDMIPTFARRQEYYKSGDADRFLIADTEFNQWLGKLKSYVEFPPDYVPVPGRLSANGIGWNNLGGFYPADGYGL